MKVKRFNESLNSKWNPTDKILKVSIKDFEVALKDIEKTDAFQREYDRYLRTSPGANEYNARRNAIYYGIEEWIYCTGSSDVTFKMVDGNGKQIDDEEMFDKSIKYNL